MKKLLALAVMLTCTASFAGEYRSTPTSTAGTSGAATSNAEATAISGSAASNQGNTQTIVFEAEDTATRSNADIGIANINGETAREVARINSDVKIRNTPSVNGSPLVSSNDTCMGSASGSVNVPGFGIGAGKTYTDDNCVMLKNSRELWNMGMKAAALALMCNDKANKEALEITGFECPQTTAEKQKAAAAAKPAATSAAGYTGDDPIVIQRISAAK